MAEVESLDLLRENFQFPRGSTHLLSGPSSSGKTYRMVDILKIKSEIIEGGRDINNIIFCYAAWQPIYDRLKREGIVSKWINKKPTNEEFKQLVAPFKHSGGSIVVIDDFMSEIDADLVEIVCVTARHHNVSTFILFQSLFPPNKFARQISLNVKFLHIFKNPRENAQIRAIALQLSPTNFKWIVEAYHKATEKPHSCFLIDLTQQREEAHRFRSRYLPAEFPMIIYKPKV